MLIIKKGMVTNVIRHAHADSYTRIHANSVRMCVCVCVCVCVRACQCMCTRVLIILQERNKGTRKGQNLYMCIHQGHVIRHGAGY